MSVKNSRKTKISELYLLPYLTLIPNLKTHSMILHTQTQPNLVRVGGAKNDVQLGHLYHPRLALDVPHWDLQFQLANVACSVCVCVCVCGCVCVCVNWVCMYSGTPL